MGCKVLFLYPNHCGNYILPSAIGILSAVLKDAGHEVDLFDTTDYGNFGGERTSVDLSKVNRLMAKPFTMPKRFALKKTNVFKDFKKKVEEFGPELIAFTSTEDLFLPGIMLLKTIRCFNILTIVGGVFPTFAPSLAFSYPEIDIVCRGEGEEALRLLCDKLAAGESYENIPNLWIKQKDGSLKVNPLGKVVNIDENPLIDVSLFEEARFYRPMAGKVYRMFPVETFRGCPYACTYCNSPSQTILYKEEANSQFLRRKSFENIRREMLFYKDTMKAEYLYFWSDNFFSWKMNEIEQFCEIYQDIKLPFWCQTRIESITHEKFKRLKEIGCHRISFGIEHGNQEFRKKVIKRHMVNQKIVKNLKIVNDVGIPFSVNNIIGFPFETYELAFDTIELNRQIEADDRNAYPFTPFHGTPLREICEKLGFVKPDEIVESFVAVGSLLDMPQFPKSQVDGLTKTFNMYVRFPKSRWPEIKKAEANTLEGNKIFEKLKQIYIAEFMS